MIEEDSASARPNAPPRKMVTEGLRKSLTKQVQTERTFVPRGNELFFFIHVAVFPRVTVLWAPTAESSFVGAAFSHALNALMLLNSLPPPPHPSFFSM